MSDRLSVRKTYKLYLGGKFPRSESGRTYLVNTAEGTPLANAALASRKDVRDAVAAARKAQAGWAGATAYLRGQIIYRIAEMLEGRRAQFIAEVRQSRGGTVKAATSEVDNAIDRLVWYAGWPDKLAQVLGGANPVAGPFFNLSTPEPVGVVAVVAPQTDPLLGLISTVIPAIVSGNAVVVLAAEDQPLPAISFGEVLATSDLPGGVVNILSGRVAELAPWLASHSDVNAVDLAGVTDAELSTDCERSAAENLKRVLRPGTEDWSASPGLDRLRSLVEIKTVWHPAGV
ncbi:aldehyde dehydrogenase family protein [Stackebrandtia endophytica]|uniref:Aldehyde dehydrogenase family protein n=1 Tax=Stackebrandtia endophytica TaxID=1496996 RepID=A0A543ATF6_9ACTN|nr:aldehyde dehydrogenase family protein [Stackebrandtia endophytica]TQL75852.1 aldehyde dehydrogenase family protein [Stackebrandtia endophytica]